MQYTQGPSWIHGSWTCQRWISLLHVCFLLLLASWYLTLLHNQLHIRTISTLVQPPQHMAWMIHGSLRDTSLESATEFLGICRTCISYLWCEVSEGSEHLWNETYVTKIIVHIDYMRRSKIMKGIYSVQRQARPSKVVVSFCFLNSLHHQSLMQSHTC